MKSGKVERAQLAMILKLGIFVFISKQKVAKQTKSSLFAR